MAKIGQDFETYNTDSPDLFYVIDDGGDPANNVAPKPVNLTGAVTTWQLARNRGDVALFKRLSSSGQIIYTADAYANLTNITVSTGTIFNGLDGVYFYTMIVTSVSGKPITVVEGYITVRQGVPLT